MADNVPILPSRASGAVEIATDDVAGIQYQVVKLALGTDGSAQLIGESMPMVDVTPGVAPLVPEYAVNVTGTASQIVVGRQGRERVDVRHNGSTGVMWLSVNGTAAAGAGVKMLKPGWSWSEYVPATATVSAVMASLPAINGHAAVIWDGTPQSAGIEELG